VVFLFFGDTGGTNQCEQPGFYPLGDISRFPCLGIAKAGKDNKTDKKSRKDN